MVLEGKGDLRAVMLTLIVILIFLLIALIAFGRMLKDTGWFS
jgi:hypothetical protein